MDSEVSEHSEEDEKPAKAPLNALFAGKGDGAEESERRGRGSHAGH